jgi:hypothetical protein
MIDILRRDKALKFLVETDEVAAKAKAYMIGLDKQEKTILAIELLKTKGATAQERDAVARASEPYAQWLKKYEESVYDFEKLRNERNSEELVVECWRSENANRRAGNIT